MKPRPNKYRAKKVKTEDGTFDSQAEYRRWCELKLLERAGEIESLQRQYPWPINMNRKPCGKYICDFYYWDKRTLKWVVEDVKGVKTATYRLKKKLVEAEWGIEIQEVAA